MLGSSDFYYVIQHISFIFLTMSIAFALNDINRIYRRMRIDVWTMMKSSLFHDHVYIHICVCAYVTRL